MPNLRALAPRDRTRLVLSERVSIIKLVRSFCRGVEIMKIGRVLAIEVLEHYVLLIVAEMW